MTHADPPKNSRRVEQEKRWTFITNHAAVLSLLVKYPRITAREVSQEVGITERSVRLIINDLEKGGYISKTREGRNVRYRMYTKRPLRHTTQPDVAVSDLLAVLKAKRSSVKKTLPDLHPGKTF